MEGATCRQHAQTYYAPSEKVLFRRLSAFVQLPAVTANKAQALAQPVSPSSASGRCTDAQGPSEDYLMLAFAAAEEELRFRERHAASGSTLPQASPDACAVGHHVQQKMVPFPEDDPMAPAPAMQASRSRRRP